MGSKQGLFRLAPEPEPEQVGMFSKWNVSKIGSSVLVFLTVLVLIPQTFVWGNLITAAGILTTIAFNAYDKNLKGV